jgi:nucleoid DNA-binding protein
MAVKKRATAKKKVAKKAAPAKRVPVIKEATIINGHLKKGGAGVCTIPGLMKIKTIHKPATRARKGTNPFTGEEMMFKAKPARNVVKVLPLKNLKAMA